MTAVTVYFGNNKASNIPIIIQTACQHTVCADHCLSNDLCTAETKIKCPKFTQQTMYILKWIAQQPQMGSKVYPYSGTWQDQPQWFIKAFNIAMSKKNQIDLNKMEKK